MTRVKHYTHKKGVTRKYLSPRGSNALLACAAILMVGGGYLLFMINAPNVKPLDAEAQAKFTPKEIGESQVIIPKIAVDTPILEGNAEVLDKGVWHRLPNLGDPDKGGNFIVTGHRYVLSRTPGQTKDKSYFYNVDKLSEGDEILIDWKKKRHTYVIKKVYAVKPTQLEVESPSTDPKLTLYTCTLGGSADGRVVIEAYPKQ